MSDDQQQQQQQQTDLERAILSLEDENDRDVLINNENKNDDGTSQASESLSSISDSFLRSSAPSPVEEAGESPRGGVDGGDFLSHLRAAGAFDSDIKNEDTFGRSRTRNNRQNLTALSALFEAPASQSVPTTNNVFQHLSNEDTIGRSNTTAATQPRLASLTDLFQRPEAKLPQPPLLSGSSSQPIHPATATVGALKYPPPLAHRPPSASPPPAHFSPKSVLKNASRSPSTITKSPHSGNESLYRNPKGGGEAPQPPRSHTVNRHNRSVSWGNNTTLGPAPAVPGGEGAGFVQRRASDKSFDSVSSLDAGNNNNHRRTDTRTQITLDDLIGNGPYEAEAESNIILALEAQQATRHHRPSLASSVSTPILGQVPEAMAHDFSLGAAPDVSEGQATLSPRSAGTSRNDNNSKDSEKVKLLNTKKPKLQRNHRRHMSVEATLVGLTEAMSALHGGNNGKKTKTRQTDEPFSSANMFAENATRLSEQQGEPHSRNDLRAASSHISSRAWRIDLSMVDEDRQIQSEDSPATTEEEEDDDQAANTRSDNDPDPEQGQIETSEEDDDDKHSGADESKITQSASTRRKHKKNNIFEEATDKLKSEWEVWGAFLRPRRSHIRYYIRTTLLYIVFPLTGIAAILFYLCGNPGSRTNDDGTFADTASVSWWFLFVVREVVTFSMALAMQGFVVDFLALGTKIMLKLVGPILTLLIVQAKGWPFICFWWAIFDLGLLASDGEISRHWLFWQDYVGLFNKENPSGSFASSGTHVTILAVVASVCAIVAVKRFVIGLYLGRQTFTHYGEKLARVMNHMLLVSEVAELAKDIERSRVDNEKQIPVISESFGWTGNLHGVVFPDDATCSTPVRSVDESNNNMMIDTSMRDPLTGSLPAQEKAKLVQLLGQWEEPTRASDPRQIEIASISAVLRFRKALTFIQKKYPFSYAFGPADTRTNCIESSQTVYERLLMHTPGEPVLQFETLALLALMDDDTIDQEKAKDLVKLFRPNREGFLSILDFTKSVDSVYKEFRMLGASIQNSSQIDRAFENMFNVGFYITLVTIVMSVLGLNPLALFLSLSSVILAFAFMIGSASSKYFEGVLFILVRRPYGIGDRIHVSDVEQNTSIEGSLGWVVEHVTLFETIATWTPTQERCSLSNGSLANSRIINAARSPQPQFHLFLKFHIDEPYEKILIFKSAIEEFMRARPREWLALNGFRASRVVADQGYVEYVIAIQHRDSWQNIGLILDSKANLSSYCNEVAKQLNMHYRAPPLPVDLRFLQNNGNFGVVDPHSLNNLMGSGVAGSFAHEFQRPPDGTALPVPLHTPSLSSAMTVPNSIVHPDISRSHHAAVEQDNAEIDREAHMKQFRHIALNKHNIRLN